MDYRKHTYDFTFEDDSGTCIKKTITGEEDKGIAYSMAREEICDNRGLTNTAFENSFELESTSHRIELKNEPWGEWDEFESDIKSIDGVKSINYVSPMKGRYSPPSYFVRTANRRDNDDIVQDIENYYGGMKVSRLGDDVEIIFGAQP